MSVDFLCGGFHLEAGGRQAADHVVQAGQFACQLPAGERDCFVGVVGFEVDFPVADADAEGF